MKTITEEDILTFENYLYGCEKSRATVRKYRAVLQGLSEFLGEETLNKQMVLAYRDDLLRERKAQSVNGCLSAIHAYLDLVGRSDCKVKFLKVQRSAFREDGRELTEQEYKRLLQAAKDGGKERLYLVMLTMGSTGIRVSELPFITVEAVGTGRTEIRLKGKTRTVLLPKELRSRLKDYARRQGIRSGTLFRTKSGAPLDRCNLCHELKGLCREAKVDPGKVFPHNFRHLFARCFYAVEKNLAYLADVLGHSRMETTRIYVATSAAAHQRTLDKMKLIL